MKKEYIKPQVEVVKLEIHHMLAASPPGWNNEVGANGLTNTDGLGWKFGGFDDEEGDY